VRLLLSASGVIMYYNRHFTPKVTKYLWLSQDEEVSLESVLPAFIAGKSDEPGLRQVALGHFRLENAEGKHPLIAYSRISGHKVYKAPVYSYCKASA